MAQIKKRSDKRRRTGRVHVRLTPDESRVVRAHAGNSRKRREEREAGKEQDGGIER